MQQQSITGGSTEARLAASYNDLLSRDPDLARRTYDALIQEQEQRGLQFGGRLLCRALRPRFITSRRAQRLSEVSRVIAAIFERAGERLLHSPELLDRIGATEQERSIWEINPGYPGFTTTSRLDSFMVGNTPRFVEYNAESPAGIAFTDGLSEVFAALPAMRAWRHSDELHSLPGLPHLLNVLLWAYHEWGGTGSPSIAIIDWENLVSRRDFELAADYFRANGCPTVISDPRKLEYRNGRLFSGETTVNLIYRRVLLHELLERADEAQAVLQAYRDGAVCMVNSPRSKLLHKKSVMALLSDRALGLDLSDAERAIVQETIPWTRLMHPGRTTFRDREVDLATFVEEHQEELVLKPSDEYGGKGVILGWETAPEEWQRAVERVMNQDYIVQERVPVPSAEFPFWHDDTTHIVPMLVDTDPLLFRGVMGSILTRISGSALLNVTAGTGSTSAPFIVDAEERE